MKTKEEIKEILNFDPLDSIAKAFGEEATKDTGLCLGVVAGHSQRVRETMKEIGDTYMGMSAQEFIDLLKFNDFQEAYREEFASDGSLECLLIFVHAKDHLLCRFDTIDSRVNSCKVHYAWRPKDFETSWKFISSGGFYDESGESAARSNAPNSKLILFGDHDGREGMFFNLRNLRNNGTFTNWPAGAINNLWLCHHGDTKDHNNYKFGQYMDKSLERFKKLPPEIQNIFTPK